MTRNQAGRVPSCGRKTIPMVPYCRTPYRRNGAGDGLRILVGLPFVEWGLIFAASTGKNVDIWSRLQVALSYEREDLRSRSDFVSEPVRLGIPVIA